jgi:hypothetical protein
MTSHQREYIGMNSTNQPRVHTRMQSIARELAALA